MLALYSPHVRNNTPLIPKVPELPADLPIVIELVGREENIRRLLPCLDTVVAEGMITMESVRILLHRHDPRDGKERT
jgi:PII-like signaling protein